MTQSTFSCLCSRRPDIAINTTTKDSAHCLSVRRPRRTREHFSNDEDLETDEKSRVSGPTKRNIPVCRERCSPAGVKRRLRDETVPPTRRQTGATAVAGATLAAAWWKAPLQHHVQVDTSAGTPLSTHDQNDTVSYVISMTALKNKTERRPQGVSGKNELGCTRPARQMTAPEYTCQCFPRVRT